MKGKAKNADYYLSDEFDAPRILNFHPVHLFLNTDYIATYEKAKPYYRNDARLMEFCNQREYGVRDFFQDLVATAKRWMDI